MSIGERLRLERERIGLNQTALGAVGGVRKQAQLKYEAGESYPNALYLNEISKIGIDVLFIVTGEKSDIPINQDEKNLIELYRNASPQVKAFMMQGVESSSKAETNQVAVGNNNIQIGGSKVKK